MSTSDKPKYLVIRAWEYGFWSDVSHVLGCLLLAEITRRIPVTHWGKGSLFSNGSNADAFQFYFKPVSTVGLDDLLALANATYFPMRWSASNLRGLSPLESDGSRVEGLLYLDRPETIAVSEFFVGVVHLLPWIPKTHELFHKPIADVYRWLAAKYLHPTESLLLEVENFYRAHIAGRSTIAVHFRGLDKRREMPRAMPTPKDYFDILDCENPSARIFLLSDDDHAIATFCERYGERVIFTNCQRASGVIGLHRRQSSDRVRLGQEVLIDVYLALRCDKFLGLGMSNISSMIAMLKPWAEATCTLQGPCVLQLPLDRIKRR